MSNPSFLSFSRKAALRYLHIFNVETLTPTTVATSFKLLPVANRFIAASCVGLRFGSCFSSVSCTHPSLVQCLRHGYRLSLINSTDPAIAECARRVILLECPPSVYGYQLLAEALPNLPRRAPPLYLPPTGKAVRQRTRPETILCYRSGVVREQQVT